jgi:hypothetical protein
MNCLRWTNLILAILALLPLLAHVLELPNKLALDGGLWLAVQQHLYRGWGPFLGGPAEIGALVTAAALLFVRRSNSRTRRLTAIATAAYGAMIVSFFLFNAPVNQAVRGWTSTTLPSDWPSYRLQWETGHALAALLAVIGLVAMVRAYFVETSQSRGGEAAIS